MNNTEYYNILGIKTDASEEEIRKAYRKLTKKYHPDLHPNDKEVNEKYKKINEAYTVLSDKEKRQKYDQGYDDNFDVNINDLICNMQNMQQSYHNNSADNIILNCSINVKSAFNGTSMNLSYNRNIICPSCNGKKHESDGKIITCTHCNGAGVIKEVKTYGFGQSVNITTCSHCQGNGYTINKPCKKCNGNGVISQNEKIKFDIPAGIVSGQTIILKNKGHANKSGKGYGDLGIQISITPYENYFINNHGDANIYYNLNIDYTQAILGDTINIKGLDDSNITFKLNKFTKDQTIMQINGKGLASSVLGKGNLNIITNIIYPTELSEKEEKLLKQIQKNRKK